MTAGAVAVPTIVPLRAPLAGQSKAVIDSDTKLELRSETTGAAIFYTLNGEKPAPFQTIGPAAKATFMYHEPFTLPGGKHTIKAVAVSTDQRESHIVTKKFEVKQLETNDDDNVDFNRSVSVSERTRKDVEKFAAKTMSWTSGIQGSKCRSDSAREGGTSKRQFAPRFMNSARGGANDRSTDGYNFDMRHVNGADGRPSHWRVPDGDASLRLQRETDFLKCTNCFAPRPTDPFARFCSECGGVIAPLPQSRIPPSAAGQIGPCVSCKGIVPLNAPNCLMCEAPLQPQNVPQASLRLADKLLCIVCGTANPPNITSCVMCAANLLANSKLQQPPVVEISTALTSSRVASKQFVQCTKCSRTNAPEARFCDWCGTKPQTSAACALACAKCKAMNGPYAQFCGTCGLVLAAPSRTDLMHGTVAAAAAGTTTTANGKAAQWVPVMTNELRLRSDAATQTVGLFYPSQHQMNQKNEEMEQKLSAMKEKYQRRPVILTAVSPGKGYWRKQMEHIGEHLKAHAANDTDFRALIGEPRMGKLLSATVREDGYELSLTVNFALRGGVMPDESYSGLPTGTVSRKGGRRSSLTRYASQESLVSNDSLSARSRPSSRRSARRPKKPELKRTASSLDVSEDDQKLLREIGKNGEGRPDEIQQLIDEGCNPSCVNKEGKPALHVAVLAGHADAVPVLVQAGADVNRKGPNHGNTALHEAVSAVPVNDDVIDALLGCGALVNRKNDKSETPFDLAVKNGHDALAKTFTTFISQSTLSRMSKPRGPSPGFPDEPH